MQDPVILEACLAMPRYTNKPFPDYRHVPGQTPHPIRDPGGHSYNRKAEKLGAFDPEDWRSCETYLYGIDLFNHGFWWETHEVLETVWIAAGRRTEAGLFIQGLIQIALAQLKALQGQNTTAQNMARKGLDKMGHYPGRYLGIDIKTFCAAVKEGFNGDQVEPVTVELVE